MDLGIFAVFSALSDQDQSGLEYITVLRFFDAHGTASVKPFGEGVGETGGHVLNDEGGRRVCRQGSQDGSEGIDASGGGPQDDDFFAGIFQGLFRTSLAKRLVTRDFFCGVRLIPQWS